MSNLKKKKQKFKETSQSNAKPNVKGLFQSNKRNLNIVLVVHNSKKS